MWLGSSRRAVGTVCDGREQMLNIVAGGVREAWVREGGLGVQKRRSQHVLVTATECSVRDFLRQLSRIA